MKSYSLPIGKWNADWALGPIRNKREEIIYLMRMIKILLVGQQLEASHTMGEIRLVVSKMSRLFLFFPGKYISVNFPFTVIEREGQIIFNSPFVSEVDSRITSQILAILEQAELFDSDCVLTFAEGVYGTAEYLEGFWSLLRHLLLHEDGYVRYDYDPENEDGRRHPLHHYDIFYSSGVTFKVGLNGGLDYERMVDFLEVATDCHFLE